MTVREVDLKPCEEQCRRGRLLSTYWVPVWRMTGSLEDSRRGGGGVAETGELGVRQQAVCLAGSRCRLAEPSRARWEGRRPLPLQGGPTCSWGTCSQAWAWLPGRFFRFGQEGLLTPH